MKLPVYREVIVKKSAFIDFWSSQYDYEYEHLYVSNIGKRLTEKRIWNLFHWKNGAPLSRKKSVAVRRFINDKTRIPPKLDTSFLSTYLNRPSGVIWRIFWLHCNRPEIYPIYDQNVHRAMARIKGWVEVEIPKNNKDKVEMYINKYLPFWDEFSELPGRRVDEALWAFGAFLKLEYDFGSPRVAFIQ